MAKSRGSTWRWGWGELQEPGRSVMPVIGNARRALLLLRNRTGGEAGT